jgi:hypothetical protein
MLKQVLLDWVILQSNKIEENKISLKIILFILLKIE